jgi:hypothetical protein
LFSMDRNMTFRLTDKRRGQTVSTKNQCHHPFIHIPSSALLLQCLVHMNPRNTRLLAIWLTLVTTFEEAMASIQQTTRKVTRGFIDGYATCG